MRPEALELSFYLKSPRNTDTFAIFQNLVFSWNIKVDLGLERFYLIKTVHLFQLHVKMEGDNECLKGKFKWITLKETVFTKDLSKFN